MPAIVTPTVVHVSGFGAKTTAGPHGDPAAELNLSSRAELAQAGANAATGMSSALRSSRAIICAFAITLGKTLYAKY